MFENKKAICKYYRLGKCRHGSTGKKPINGRECLFDHPCKCLKYCKYGNDISQGCNGSCDLLHPVLCQSSVMYKQCFRPDCTLAHMTGTDRQRNVMPSYNTGNRYFNNSNVHPPRYLPRVYKTGLYSRSNFERNNNDRSNYPEPNMEQFAYNQNDFPKLPIPEVSKFSQLSNDISQLKSSMEYLLKTNCNKDHQRNIIENDRCGQLIQNQVTQINEPKNYQCQNQYYPEQDHLQH